MPPSYRVRLCADPSEVQREADEDYRRSGQSMARPATRRGAPSPGAPFPRTGAEPRHKPRDP